MIYRARDGHSSPKIKSTLAIIYSLLFIATLLMSELIL
jgi:hypothetical protein